MLQDAIGHLCASSEHAEKLEDGSSGHIFTAFGLASERAALRTIEQLQKNKFISKTATMNAAASIICRFAYCFIKLCHTDAPAP